MASAAEAYRDEIISLREKGVTYVAMAKTLPLSAEAINRAMLSWGYRATRQEPPEVMERLKHLWLVEELLAGEVARALNAEFGVTLTRNAVIGRAGRSGWTRSPEVALCNLRRLGPQGNPSCRKGVGSGVTKDRAPRPKVAKAPETRPGRAARKPHASISASAASIAIAPRPWITRRAGECAFPVDGEGADTRSCCNATGVGAYCAGHDELMRDPMVRGWARFSDPSFAKAVA
ncbi:MAG: hypothetical protein KA105_02660 [Caulobacter sp.]|nr:hypothetical protein [Caulobacter sp.]